MFYIFDVFDMLNLFDIFDICDIDRHPRDMIRIHCSFRTIVTISIKVNIYGLNYLTIVSQYVLTNRANYRKRAILKISNKGRIYL